jgi:hypothetical protein
VTLTVLSSHQQREVREPVQMCLDPIRSLAQAARKANGEQLPYCGDDDSQPGPAGNCDVCASTPCDERNACIAASCGGYTHQRAAIDACLAGNQCTRRECVGASDAYFVLRVGAEQVEPHCVRRDGLVCASTGSLVAERTNVAYLALEQPAGDADDDGGTDWSLVVVGLVAGCCVLVVVACIGVALLSSRRSPRQTTYVETGHVDAPLTNTRRNTTFDGAFESARDATSMPVYDSVPPESPRGSSIGGSFDVRASSTQSGYTRPPASPRSLSSASNYTAPPPPSSAGDNYHSTSNSSGCKLPFVPSKQNKS